MSQVPSKYLSALSKSKETNTEYTVKVCTEDSDGDGTVDYMVVVSSNTPEHESSYFEEGHDHYEDYDYNTNVHKYDESHDDQAAHSADNNKIETQNLVMRIPINPKKAESPTKTSFATIGLAINGVSFFNENAAPGDDITNELFTFDQCSGHPQQQGVYHYHIQTAEYGAASEKVFWITNEYYYGVPGSIGNGE